MKSTPASFPAVAAAGLLPALMFSPISCSVSRLKPPGAAEIAQHQAQRIHWEGRIKQVKPGMTRAQVERILPQATFEGERWSGNTGQDHVVSGGMSGWHYLDRNFVCVVSYTWSGLTKNLDEEVERFYSRERLREMPRLLQVTRPPSQP